MARLPGFQTTYLIGERFRSQCLTGNGSLLWPTDTPWSQASLDELWRAFVEHPDTTEDADFLEKLGRQLENASDDAVRVAVDALAFYLLYPTKYSTASKLKLLNNIIGWRRWMEPPDLVAVTAAFEEGGIGFPGTFYNTGRPFHFAYLIQLARLTLQEPTAVNNIDRMVMLGDEALKMVSKNVSIMRNVALYVMFPDDFERVASDSQRVAITRRYAELTDRTRDVNTQLKEIRSALAQQLKRPELDFYDQDIWEQWKVTAPDSDELATPITSLSDTRVWVEKTIVAGRQDRIEGAFALGKRLWSPARAVGGADMYRYMRDISAGDVILHLTDNRGFSGISRAAGSFQEFGGVANTDWSDRPSYYVPLEGFEKLDPPLQRETFLGTPYKAQLLQLLANGLKNTFYGKDGNLNQGAYITPAPPRLVDILNAAYQSIAGRDLTVSAAHSEPELEQSDASVPANITNLARATFMDVADAQELVDIARHRKQVVLEGPPGSGKTFVATLLARYLAGVDLASENVDRILTVQFHQSYGYEDFVEGIRPSVTDSGHVTYNVQPGAFREFCERASEHPESQYVCVVDEINRGNLSRILGELLFLLEYRERSVSLTYSGASGERFRIPANVYLLGTMNNTDRSLSQLDYALRRRFYFYRLAPLDGDAAPVLDRWLQSQKACPVDRRIELLRAFVALNKRLAEELGEDFQVGHSYLMEPNIWLDKTAERVWRRAIQPLLEEYFYNRKNRQQLVTSLGWAQLKTAQVEE